MNPTIGEKIVRDWLDTLAERHELNPSLLAALHDLAENNQLKNAEKLKQVITDLESYYDKNEN